MYKIQLLGVAGLNPAQRPGREAHPFRKAPAPLFRYINTLSFPLKNFFYFLSDTNNFCSEIFLKFFPIFVQFFNFCGQIACLRFNIGLF